MNYIKDINLKNKDNTYNVIIEIPKYTKNKYELKEPEFNELECVRKVKKRYPFYYGCFPQTWAEDNDPLDMILITSKKYKKLDVVKVVPIGVIKTIDNGEEDDKILVIPVNYKLSKMFNENRIYKFLSKYKGRKADMKIDKKEYDCLEAIKIIEETQKNYRAKEKSKDVLKSF